MLRISSGPDGNTGGSEKIQGDVLQGRQLGERRSNYRQGPDGSAKQAQGDGRKGYLSLPTIEKLSKSIDAVLNGSTQFSYDQFFLSIN